MASEKRRFGMHQNLLYDVILRQAGTLQKAILEGAMNAVDADATACHITLDTHRFSISDDGHGFQSRQEIEEFFETFGTPHEEGDAVYGRYRMGRGQMMAFGVNTWRSRWFEMQVDIKNFGLDYNLTVHDEDRAGTTVDVDLYDPIIPSDLERIKSELRNFVAWAQIPVYLNGEQISKTPAEGKWTYEDEHAYYALSAERAQLSIYNLGVLVNSFPAGRFGMGGTVVSKKQLEVNFARNDVQSTCPEGKAISAYIRKVAGTGIKKKTKLTDAERDLLVRDFLAGEMDSEEACKLRVLTDVNGRNWQMNKIAQIPRSFSSRLAVAERGDQMMETAQRRGVAFTIDQGTLERFGVSDAAGFLARVAQASRAIAGMSQTNFGRGSYELRHMAAIAEEKITIADRDDLRAFVSDDHIALVKGELTNDQKALLYAIERGYSALVSALNQARYEDRFVRPRNIHLGKSESALAWTDGLQSIWIDVEHARLLRRGYAGAHQIAGTLLHEQLHEGPDTGTHQHDFAFYQAYHDLSGLPQDPIGQAAHRMVATFITRLQTNKKKVSKKLLQLDDTDLQLQTLRQELEAEEDIQDA